MELFELSASEAASRMRAGSLRPTEYAGALLERLEKVEPRLLAMAHFDSRAMLAAAAGAEGALEAARAAGKEPPPLAGIPVGVKDNIDTAGSATRAGSPVFANRVPTEDAACLRALWRAGAYLHGKTVTTELAYFDPGPTHNPWRLPHTPGGSSSGSAAGVAAGLFPLALGTQTAGSVVRPAAFCGVVGFVPTRAQAPLEGVVPFAPSVDQLGIFARSVDDALLTYSALTAGPDGAPARLAGATRTAPLDRGPFLGVAREYFVETAEDEMGRAAIHAAKQLTSAGAVVHVVHLPASFAQVHAQHRRLMEVEMARQHRERFLKEPELYGKRAAELIRAGLAAREEEYRRALAHRERFRSDVSRLLREVDALLLPAAPFAAPYGLESTGDPRFSVPWTNAGLPIVTLPVALSMAGLPLSIQLVGAAGSDLHLLQVARFAEEKLGWGRRMPPFAG